MHTRSKDPTGELMMPFNPLQFVKRRLGFRSTADGAFSGALEVAREISDIPTYRPSLPALVAELTRARRYERPLAIVVLELERECFIEQGSRVAGKNGNGNGADRVALARTAQVVSFILGSILRGTLRESDIAAYAATEDRYVILLAESDQVRAQNTVQRLHELFQRRAHAHFRAGIAEFPADGVTLGELVSSAQREWRHRSVQVSELSRPAIP